MKVDIWIQTDDGGELHKENLKWSEACCEICNAHILEELCKTIEQQTLETYSIIKKDTIEDESNKN